MGVKKLNHVLLGGSWPARGHSWGPSWAVPGRSRAALGRTCGPNTRPDGAHEHSFPGYPGSPRARIECTSTALGRSWVALGGALGPLLAVRMGPGMVLGPFWEGFRGSCSGLESIQGGTMLRELSHQGMKSSGAIILEESKGSVWDAWGAFCVFWGPWGV